VLVLAPVQNIVSGSSAAIVRPTFSRDFAGEKTLDNGTGPNITFTRNSNATFFDATGTLQTAGSNVPRFDHSGGSSLGLLIEEARTNLFERSAEFDDGAWSLTSPTSVTANVTATTAPDGSSTADKLVEGNNANAKRIFQSLTAATTQDYTISVFAKAAERDRLRLGIREGVITGSFYVSAVFDLAAGTLGAVGTGTTATITSVGNGWYRLTAAGSVVGGTRSPQFLMLDANDSSLYTGDGTSGLYLWGAQLEVGAFPTSYIPTTTAAATRAVDVATVTPVSSFWNQAEGTMFVEFQSLTVSQDAGSSRRILQGDSGAGTDALWIAQNGSNDSLIMARTGGGWSIVLGSNITSITRAIVGFATDNVNAAVNGTLGTDDTSAIIPSVTALRIGRAVAAARFHGHIRKIAYWPKRLTNTLLEQLTT